MSTSTCPTTARRAVLWDLDGTLIDSGEYHWLAWQETLATEGVALSHEEFMLTFGQRNDRILRLWLGVGTPEAEIERIGLDKEECYRRLVRARGVQLLPGAAYWLERLSALGWRQALASSAPRLNVRAILDALQIEAYFAAAVSGEDVQQGKPDPQVFLLAAARVGALPACCVVVEDSAAGVEGARRAGMRSVGVGLAHATLPADIKVASLAELPQDVFEQLVEA